MLEELKALADIQLKLYKVRAQIVKTQSKNIVDNQVANVEKAIDAVKGKARNIKDEVDKSKSERQAVVNEYKMNLENAIKNYDEQFAVVLGAKSDLENQELQKRVEQAGYADEIKAKKAEFYNARKEVAKVLKSKNSTQEEIMEATKQLVDLGDNLSNLEQEEVLKYSMIEDEIKSIQNRISDLDSEYNTLYSQKEQEIAQLGEDKETSLANIPKKNIFTVMYSKISAITKSNSKKMKEQLAAVKEKAIAIKEDAETKLKDKVENTKQRVAEKVTETKESVESRIDLAKTKTHDYVMNRVEKVNELAEQFQEKIVDLKDKTKTKVKEKVDGVKSKVQEVKNNVGEKVQATKDKVVSTIDTAKSYVDKAEEYTVGKVQAAKMSVIDKLQIMVDKKMEKLQITKEQLENLKGTRTADAGAR